LAVARRWTWVWLLRALVLRARDVVPLRRVVLLERALVERVLELRVELLRRLFWLVAMWRVLLLGCCFRVVLFLSLLLLTSIRSIAANTRSNTSLA
jgi:hypothetical protein